ncbi:HEXA_B [Acanthosepion pharaonis]|uniref:beta-N-acetylhexosaminidase n=1 Tax=Acanthosepion pharaonis TaxID=158019 RepID=A0A812E8E4_ACAPH|nr:HEXA_B [Sepia pharaonis]
MYVKSRWLGVDVFFSVRAREPSLVQYKVFLMMDQKSLDLLADNLDIKYEVLDNICQGRKIFQAAMTLTNKCSVPLSYGEWAIYFCHLRMIEPTHLSEKKFAILKDYGVKFSQIAGCLFKLEPVDNFKTLNQNDSLRIVFLAQYYSVAKTDVLPNWYMTFPNLRPHIIKCTANEELSFVAQFENASQWKRYDYEMSDGKRRYDVYDPFTPEVRFERNKSSYDTEEEKSTPKQVIPTPLYLEVKEERTVNLKNGNWVIHSHEALSKEAEFLAESLNLKIVAQHPVSKYISFQLVQTVELPSHDHPSIPEEAYTLSVDCDKETVVITSSANPGSFWAIQTLFSLLKDNQLPQTEVIDAPRYCYRGLHVDVVRNFHGKQTLFKLIDGMVMYKMNKLHLHLTDDEGWRIEIPGLEELTSVGGFRGHNTERNCILPLLGSGPECNTSGSGYYSVKDYREILMYATKRHVEVIPEIDMPGHCNAAIQATKSRYERLKNEEYFVQQVAAIVHKHGLNLGAWQDGMMSAEGPFERSSLPSKDVLVYAWQNVWESGKANAAYLLANAGYKVVMSQATHLYFDHPYEPDPEERGLYWAARFIDTEKVFKFIPDDLYSNADYKLTGEPLSMKDIKAYEKRIVKLKIPENIIGVQGQLWSELVRTSDQLESMIFPRLIAMAERAWHKASWENETDKTKRDAESKKDWAAFANSLGSKELARLDALQIAYHIVPPGARFEQDGQLKMNCTYPGLPIQYSIDEGETWTTHSGEPVYIPSESRVILQTSSTDRYRSSRQIEMSVPTNS